MTNKRYALDGVNFRLNPTVGSNPTEVRERCEEDGLRLPTPREAYTIAHGLRKYMNTLNYKGSDSLQWWGNATVHQDFFENPNLDELYASHEGERDAKRCSSLVPFGTLSFALFNLGVLTDTEIEDGEKCMRVKQGKETHSVPYKFGSYNEILKELKRQFKEKDHPYYEKFSDHVRKNVGNVSSFSCEELPFLGLRNQEVESHILAYPYSELPHPPTPIVVSPYSRHKSSPYGLPCLWDLGPQREGFITFGVADNAENPVPFHPIPLPDPTPPITEKGPKSLLEIVKSCFGGC
jgi:hypothetical protein